MADHYVEWVDKFVIVNAPSFINMLYTALTPFMPDRFKKRVIFTSSDKKKQTNELLSMIDADYLPVHYGGRMTDDKGDAMCRAIIPVPQPVPKELYWKPKEGEPKINEMSSLSVPAAGQSLLGYAITEPNSSIEFFIYNEQECSFAIYYTTDEKITNVKKMEQVYINVVRAGLTTLDHLTFLCDRAGLYYIKFGNESAWLMPVTVKYSLRFRDAGQSTIVPRTLHKTNSNSSWFF